MPPIDSRYQEQAKAWISPEYAPGLVSVIIPTYNRGHIITETLDSVYDQSYRPIQLIVIDDGSTDNTKQIVNRWKEKHDNDQFKIAYLYQGNKGACAARNAGTRASHGQFIQFLDSDDLLLSDKITKSVQAIREGDFMFSVCDCAKFKSHKDNIIEVSHFSERPNSPLSHLVSSKLNTQGPLFLRSTINLIGPWSEDLDIWQDTEFCFRILALNLPGVWIPEILVLIRHSEQSIMNRDIRKVCYEMLHASEKIEEIARDMGIYDREFGDIMGRRLATVSRLLAASGEWSKSWKIFFEAIGRMSFRNKILHSFHRCCLAVFGRKAMERLGLM